MSTSSIVGIDVGGTFTDAVLVSADGEIRVAKSITTVDQSVSAVEVVAKLRPDLEEIGGIVHGTTVATNAILERKGAEVGLITTDGFRDVLEFQRQERRNIWDLFVRKPEPLVRRRRRLGVPERIMASGAVRTELDRDAARESIAELRRDGCDAIAVCFLNSYANPAHERDMEVLLEAEAPELYPAVSSRLAPHFREYDRMSTTVLSAYVGPKIRAYLSRFRQRFAERGFSGRLLVMGSNGGVIPPETAAAHAATTCLSGPAGGVLATVHVAAGLGIRNAISFDMGGTSTDVSLIRDGAAATSARAEIAGLPISLPQIRIETVSAGGGSIASIDSGGLLHVGPQSAGSNPGPACYGFGGRQPTVTDAAFLMGLLRASHFFGGEMRLDRVAAEEVYGELTAAVGASVEASAEKVLTIANHKMAHAVRLVSVREGHDPRDYALFAFGGAGPLHACAIAEELGIRRVVVPMHPGAFSAFGLLCADLKRDFVRSVVVPFSRLDDATLLDMVRGVAAEAELSASEMAGSEPMWFYQAECRYQGQAYEVAVDITESGAVLAKASADFNAAHARQFGFANPDSEIELVNIRATAVLPRDKPVLPRLPDGRGDAPRESGPVFVGGIWRTADFLSRASLGGGDHGSGPLVIEEPTATTYVPDGWSFAVDATGHIVIERN